MLPATESIEKAYPDHVEKLQRRAEEILQATGFAGWLVHSGTQMGYHADDQHAPFRSTPHFRHWLPLSGPGHSLVLRPSQRPLLVRFAPEDFWYEQSPLGSPYWAEFFEIREVGSADQLPRSLPDRKGLAFVGDCPAWAEQVGFAAEAINPAELVARLDWNRSLKTDYEIACVQEASRHGARAHQAAREVFLEGGSELDIHYAYLTAVRTTESLLPYNSIVALNDRGAILHYEGKRTEKNGKVLLIDSGADVLGYASDITRTWTREGCEPLFQEMVERFDRLQQNLCKMVKPGLPYPDLHHQAHVWIGDLLNEVGVLKVAGDEATERGLTRPFFPHGLGHFLGIQVHDVAGHQAQPKGGNHPPPELHPHLRTTRTIAENQVFTVEPGVYFIDMLLREHRSSDHADAFDWPLIDRLTACGGIRIEDNLVVTADGHRNLTRQFLD
jgi:Xaa-Pro dipeptidase